MARSLAAVVAKVMAADSSTSITNTTTSTSY